MYNIGVIIVIVFNIMFFYLKFNNNKIVVMYLFGIVYEIEQINQSYIQIIRKCLKYEIVIITCKAILIIY